ncbi:spore coat protein GerQ [Mesobacillus foraminis]|uniref:Spore germination protein Q n=1 Tax=Mesobacillus foraminis TaxID=279826 RepID=A0A4R2BAN6_9BACI|nr:spore coat protein GerQ [Mesobacillus foraminis]TCN24007.1 spore germination protein Q [Mesobacillus foraminis]
MSQSNYPYYNYRTYPQAYMPYAAGQQQQPPGGYSGSQMGYPYSQGGGQDTSQQMGGMNGGIGGMSGGMGGMMGGMPGGMGGTGGYQGVEVPGMLPSEESYVENILRLNKGKLVTVYMSFEGSREWNSKVFKGIIEAAGRDHLILSDPQTGMRYLLLMVYLDYVTFEEEIEYDYPFAGGAGAGLASYPPR